MDDSERNAGEAWLSVGWQTGTPEPGDPTFEHGAAFAGVLARTLVAAGYQPRRLDIRLQRGAEAAPELHVSGDIPGMAQADFESLTLVTMHALRLRKDVAGDTELVVVARLTQVGSAVSAPPLPPRQIGPAPSQVATAVPTQPPPPTQLPPKAAARALGVLPLPRLVTGLVLGLFLGVVGLPRLDLSLPGLPSAPQPVVLENVTPVVPPPAAALSENPATPIPPTPRVAPAAATATPVAIVAAAAVGGPGLVFAERFASPVVNWPNDPNGPAWFGDGGLHLLARQSGRFVALGVPRIGRIGDGILSAQFHKVAGPSGGGYGFIIRDQGGAAERDSRSQAGQYVVLEVGDRGDIGVWQRDQSRWIDVVPWTHSDAVRPGVEPNTLVVYTLGSAIRFEVNGEVVGVLNYDGLPTTGGVGMFVGGDLNEVALEWLRIETL
jgi:hypothetical protein